MSEPAERSNGSTPAGADVAVCAGSDGGSVSQRPASPGGRLLRIGTPAKQNHHMNHFRFIQWDITSRCNLRCVHCRSESFYGSDALEPDMPLDAVRERLDDLYAKGIRRIHFLGGEPFCRRDLPDIVRHASALGILCSINTNGTLIDAERAEAIVEAGAYLLTFSIDGPDAATHDAIRGHGAFARVLRGIEHMHAARRKHRLYTRLICCHVVMRPNVTQVDKMVDLCSRIGLQNLIITGLRRMGGAIASWDALAISDAERMEVAERVADRLRSGARCNVQIDICNLLEKLYLNAKYGISQEVKRGGCDAVSGKAYVQPDGAVFPCQDIAKAVGRGRERESIRAKGLSVWESSRFTPIALGTLTLQAYENYSPCRSCPALGTLCTPCPLRGLKGEVVTQAACTSIMERAAKEGVDLRKAVEAAIGCSAADRILQDPGYRAGYLSAQDAGQFVQKEALEEPLRESLVKLQDEVLAEMGQVLRCAEHKLESGVAEA